MKIETMKIMGDNPIIQIGYVVPDLKEAVQSHFAIFGSGPNYLVESITNEVFYRTKKMDMCISSAFGQWGEVQVEIVQQHSPEQSYFTESNRFGIHHVAIFVDDICEAIKEFAALDCEVAGYETGDDGLHRLAMIDCRQSFGHYIELYSSGDAGVKGLYSIVKKISLDWDKKTDILRTKF